MNMEDFEISVELAILITWRVLKITSARKLPPEVLVSFSGVSVIILGLSGYHFLGIRVS